MVNAVSVRTAGAPVPFATPDPVALAARIVRDNMANGRADLPGIRRDLDAVRAQDPELGAAVQRHVDARLTPVQRGQLASATYAVRAPDGEAVTFAADAPSVADHRAQAPGSPGRALYDRMDRMWGDRRPGTDDTSRIEAGLRAMQASGLSLATAEATQFASSAPPQAAAPPDRVKLVADLTQMALDLTGIVDPTPISDGSNAIISAGRAIGSMFGGEWKEAGGHLGNGVLSAAGILPILGDAAKIGKIGKWAQTVADAVATVAHNPALRATFEPSLRAIRDAVASIPAGVLDKLPSGARESIERMKGQLDEFFGAAGRTFSGAVTATAERLGIPPEKVQAIADAGRGNRPTNPADYLSTSRIAEHARAFEGGGSRFTMQSSIDDYGLGQTDGTTFIMTRAEADQLVASTGGDPRKLEAALGLPVGQLDDGQLMRVDFSPQAMDDLGMRMPNGNEAGANTNWLPGGLVPSGANEAVIDGARARPEHYVSNPVPPR